MHKISQIFAGNFPWASSEHEIGGWDMIFKLYIFLKHYDSQRFFKKISIS